MTPAFGMALLGARIDGVDPSPLVACAYLLSAMMFACALWLRSGRIGNRIALAALALAAGAALYSHDVVNLPEITCALVAGGGVGLLLARRSSTVALPWLVVAGHGLSGLVAMATGATLFLNPFAFGLAGGDGAIAPGNGLMLAAGVALGLLVLAGALLMTFRRTQAGLALIGGGAGWAAAALGFALGNGAMVMAGGLAGVAAWRLGWRARRIGRTPVKGLAHRPALPLTPDP